MLTLNSLKPNLGATSSRKRLGRGPGSGLGQTSGKGEKGQLARSGGSVRPGFEGGQMPLYRRIPKRGFKSISRLRKAEITLSDLERLAEQGLAEVSLSSLIEMGLVKRSTQTLVVLGNGKLTRKVQVLADRVSDSARGAIEKLGGTV